MNIDLSLANLTDDPFGNHSGLTHIQYGSKAQAHLDLALSHYHQEDWVNIQEITAALETEDTLGSVIVQDNLNRFSGLDIDE